MTAKAQATLRSEVDTTLASGSGDKITGTELRGFMRDFIDSAKWYDVDDPTDLSEEELDALSEDLDTTTAAEIFAGTAGKLLSAANAYDMQQSSGVASVAGVLTLTWNATNIPSYTALCSVTENITSIVVSSLPLWQTCFVVFELTGAYSITVPDHGDTVDSLEFYRIDNDTWPTFPSEADAVVMLSFTKTATRIYCGVAGICSAP
jgi:hypothetical protein